MGRKFSFITAVKNVAKVCDRNLKSKFLQQEAAYPDHKIVKQTNDANTRAIIQRPSSNTMLLVPAGACWRRNTAFCLILMKEIL